MERVIVDVVNKVGVDINRAVTDSYYQHLLEFVSGLGPRKAQVLVKKIASMVRVQDGPVNFDAEYMFCTVAISSTETSSSRMDC